MQYNDTTNKTGLLQDCEFLLNLGDTGITGDTTLKAIFTRNINSWYHKIISMVMMSMDDWDWDDSSQTDYPVATTPLVAGQRDYTFPTSLKILRIKRVDVTYDNSTYYRCEKWDSSSTGLGLGNDTNTDGRFSRTEPVYDVRANSVWLYPMATAADVSAGAKLRIEFSREPIEFTTSDTTKEPAIDEPFHRMLSIGASLDYATAKNLPIKADLAAMMADYEGRLRQYYSIKDGEQVMALLPGYINYT